MKTFRDRFEENYIAVPRQTEKGKVKVDYVYYGPWYYWDIPRENLKKVKLRSVLLCSLSTLLYLACGFFRTAVNTYLLVMVPSLLSICALIYEIIGTVRFAAAAYPTTRPTYEDVNRMLCLAPHFHAILMIVTAIMCGWVLVMADFEPAGIVVMLGYLLSAALSLFLRKEYMALPLRTERNKAADELIDGEEDAGNESGTLE